MLKEFLLSHDKKSFIDSKTHVSIHGFSSPVTPERFCATIDEHNPSVFEIQAYGTFEYIPVGPWWLKTVTHNHRFVRMHLTLQTPDLIRYKMTLAYNGTHFEGFQRQKKAIRTVQHTLESILSHLFDQTIEIHPASRTDKGVHATGQVVHFDAPRRFPPDVLMDLCERMCPEDISIGAIDVVPEVFHARYDVLSKRYVYRLRTVKDVAMAHQVHVVKTLDLETLNASLNAFVGTHDFNQFAKTKDVDSTVRTIEAAFIKPVENGVDIYIQGQGFMRYMIRIMIGALLRYDTPTIQEALKHPTVSLGKYKCPAHALSLEAIDYGQV